MNCWLFLASLAFLPACSGNRSAAPEPQRAAAAVDIPEATEAHPEPTPAEVPGDVLPDELQEPALVACRLGDASFSSTLVRLETRGKPFAILNRAPSTLLFPEGAAKSGVIVVDDGSVVLRGVLDAGDVELYAASPTILARFLVPRPGTRLAWVSGDNGGLRVSISTRESLEWPDLVEDRVPCDKLSLRVQSFTARQAVTQAQKFVERETAAAGAGLAVEPGVAPAGKLRPKERVSVIETSGSFSRILFEDSKLVAFGWVPNQNLVAAPPRVGHGRLSGSHRTLPRIVREGRTCSRDLSLWAELGERRLRIGLVRGGTRFAEQAPAPTAEPGLPPPRGSRSEPRYIGIRLPLTRWLELTEDAKLLVPEAEHSECAAANAPH
ncbi:MAG: hypothetical protein U0263_18105 [Polyangiaceae bacterium]